ncbi:MAG: N-glycosylase/DNA lyase [Calditrichaeota bacterium]|nr:N-glycosylase/DNA lyase [Calditrichota bacterium]
MVEPRDVRVVECAFEYLSDLVGTSEEELRGRFKPDPPTDMPGVFVHAISTAKNRDRISNAFEMIFLQDGETLASSSLSDLLCAFDPNAFLETYRSDEHNLLEQFRNRYDLDSNLRKMSVPVQIAKSIVSIAEFLVQFENISKFKKYISAFYDNDATRPALPLVLKEEIHGFGYALACDFLKEVGYDKYGKPDRHVKEILFGLNLCEEDATDFRCQQSIVRIADNSGVTPYVVDKLFYCIGSGRCFEGESTGRRSEDFIRFCANRM